MFAEVVLANPIQRFDRPYDYSLPSPSIPEEKIEIGSQVLVPFGSRLEVGYVIGFKMQPAVAQVKPIAKLLSRQIFFDAATIENAHFIADHYGAFFIKALRLFMPPGQKSKEKKKRQLGLKANRTQKVEQSQPTTLFVDENKLGEAAVFLPAAATLPTQPFVPTKPQQLALNKIGQSWNNQKASSILICGVTGSGKTEIYLQAVARALQERKTALVLVPEIILTPQLVERFAGRFGENLSILHSGRTVAERQKEWEKINAGEIRVVLGTRAALFAPLKNLGIIILDEEFENTYKSDQSPRYHARTVAEFMSRQKKIPLVLGSATPAVESYFKALAGEYELINLPERINQYPLPPVTIVDMRAELKRGNRSILSRALCQAMAQALESNEQIILYLDHFFGGGIPKVAQAVLKTFPKARVMCLEKEGQGHQIAHAAIYAAFKNGKADILIGSQLVTKGQDIGRITVAGIISVDNGLNLPDFRAAERTFQQLVQVAGRVGRQHLPGKVFIQTNLPEHYAIVAAASHDYPKFYEEEIKLREEAQFPPLVDLIRLIFSAEEENAVASAAEKFAQELKTQLRCEILGPAPAPLARVRGKYRHHILVKTKKLAVDLQNLRRKLETNKLPPAVNLTIDVDPQSML